MLNELDPSLFAVSLAVQVTVVTPTGYRPMDTTMSPAWSLHTIVLTEMMPSQASLAVAVNVQLTAASGIPGSTFVPEISGGTVTTGPTMSAHVTLSAGSGHIHPQFGES